MGRHLNEAQVTTPNARKKLAKRKAPYWRHIELGFHLGYRKGVTGGSWVVRLRKSDRTYTTAAIGIADDVLPANAATSKDRPYRPVLSFDQAFREARVWFEKTMQQPGGKDEGKPFTVGDAMANYLEWYRQHRKALYQVTQRINADILPALGDTSVVNLTSKRIRKWHEGLATAPPRVRSAGAGPQRTRKAPTDPEGIRRRRATANKVLVILKASLNRAFADGEVDDDTAWRRVKPYRDVEAGAPRYITVDQATRLINACEPDFRALVRGALLTGTRYGELIAMQVRDFNPDGATVHVRVSKSGKPRHVPLTDEGRTFFYRLSAGRQGADRIFLRSDGAPWRASHQKRRLADACKAASIEPPISFHILRHTYASWLIMEGVSLEVIADALGHSDTRVTKRHYAALAPSYVADEVRAHLPALGLLEDDNVVEIGRK